MTISPFEEGRVITSDGRTITLDKINGKVVIASNAGTQTVNVPPSYLKHAAKLLERFGESSKVAAEAFTKASVMVATNITNESRDAIKMLREMLRQAERGEVVLTKMSIRNQQPDRWESSGPMERLRLDNTFKVELEMHAYDRRAATQPPNAGVAVDIDDKAMEVLTVPTAEYVTLQGRNPRTNYRLPVQPLKTLPERILQRVEMGDDREYNTLRISYETRDRMMLERMIDPVASPANFLGLDLLVEAPGGQVASQAMPRFEDDEAEARDWQGITDYDVAMGRTVARRAPPQSGLQARAAQAKPKAKDTKPKTPAGASAAREIIFDD